MKIVTTSITKPPVICIYGPPGVGKSRFAASMPKAFFIRTEDRHDHLSVQSHEGIISTYDQLIEVLDWLQNEEHDFKTVVLDTADSCEKIIHAKVCEGTGTTDILHPKAFPFYSGFVKAANVWEKEILGRLKDLNILRKIMPVILSHVQTIHVEHPQYGSYPKFFPGVDKRVGAKIFKIADIVGFLDWQTTTKGEEGSLRLQGSGQRLLRLKPKPVWETKESYNLPDSIDIPEDKPGELGGWKVLSDAIRAGLKERVSGNLSEVKIESDVKKLIKE